MKYLLFFSLVFSVFNLKAQSYGQANMDAWLGLTDYLLSNRYATIEPYNISQNGCNVLRNEIWRLNGQGYNYYAALKTVNSKLESANASYESCKYSFSKNFHIMCSSQAALCSKYTRQFTKINAIYVWSGYCPR